jgi:hypothetical protein
MGCAEYVDSILRPPAEFAVYCFGYRRGWLGTGFRNNQRSATYSPGANSDDRLLFQKRAA